MALYQVNAGDRILAADINQTYNLLKGVAASGEGITLIYNAAGVLILQPSSDPATGTELIQVKNNAGTVQSALSSDGLVYAGIGAVGLPAFTFELDKDTGIYRIGANTIGIAAGGAEKMRIDATGVSTDGGTSYLGLPVAGSGERTAGDVTTASTSFVDATDVTTTLTLPTGTSGKVHVSVSGITQNTNVTNNQFEIMADGVAKKDINFNVPAAATDLPFGFDYLCTGLTAGARVFKLRWSVTAGTGKLRGGTVSLFTTTITAVEVR